MLIDDLILWYVLYRVLFSYNKISRYKVYGDCLVAAFYLIAFKLKSKLLT